jgi:hypothetical protein
MDAHEAVQTYDCKQPGCTNEARSRVGRYSYCPEHQGQGSKASRRFDINSATVEQKIKSLASQARAVDKAKAKARHLTEQALQARADADEQERAFQEQARELLAGEDAPGVRIVA